MEAATGTRSDGLLPTVSRDGGSVDVIDWRDRLGAAGVVLAILTFAVTVAVSLRVEGTAYAWQVNMISDLGDGSCRTRGGRWICSPGFALFNTGLIATGVLLSAAGAGLRRRWGRLLAGSLAVMGVGLVIAGVFPAGDAGALHLAGVVLALVVPGCGLLISAIRPATAWLSRRRALRGVLAATSLVFAAENRLPHNFVPQGAGELVIVGCLLVALLVESVALLAARSGGRRNGR